MKPPSFSSLFVHFRVIFASFQLKKRRNHIFFDLKQHSYQTRGAFLPNAISILTKREKPSYSSQFQTNLFSISAFLLLQSSSFRTILQTRRVWQPKSTSLVTKVDEFGHQSRRVWSSRLSEIHHKQVSTMLQFRLNNDTSP